MGEFQRLWGTTLIVAASLMISGCGSSKLSKRSKVDPKYGVVASPRVVEDGKKIPVGGGRYMVGKPYTIAGKRYYPRLDRSYNRKGLASWYGAAFHGRKTANGEIYDMRSLTAAHPTMPLPSYARVTNLKNGRSVIVRVNDRGPFHGGRVIDVSKRVAEVLDFKRDGISRVRVRYIGKARLDGRDHRYLMASYKGPGSIARPTMVASSSVRPPARIGKSKRDRRRARPRRVEVASFERGRAGSWTRPEAGADDREGAFSLASVRRAIDPTRGVAAKPDSRRATGAPMVLFDPGKVSSSRSSRRMGSSASSYAAQRRVSDAFAAIDHLSADRKISAWRK